MIVIGRMMTSKLNDELVAVQKHDPSQDMVLKKKMNALTRCHGTVINLCGCINKLCSGISKLCGCNSKSAKF